MEPINKKKILIKFLFFFLIPPVPLYFLFGGSADPDAFSSNNFLTTPFLLSALSYAVILGCLLWVDARQRGQGQKIIFGKVSWIIILLVLVFALMHLMNV